ncbi:TetR family transcriptional regulator, partial [Nonomuraea sp. NPDC001684]
MGSGRRPRRGADADGRLPPARVGAGLLPRRGRRAEKAGVAVQTIYFVFGNKRALLKELVDVTIA